MANAVYTISFTSLWGSTSASDPDDYTLEIWSAATNTNPAIPIKCSSSPIKINWRQVSDIFEPVITSEAVVEVISETDLYWRDFFTADRGDWILKVIRNGSTIWQGQNITESYNEPYLGTPYKSTIRFSDLGDLDFIYYQPTSTTFYSGYKSLAEIILTCTNKLAFSLDICEYTNCINLEGWNNSGVTDKSLLCNTFLDVSVFRTHEDNIEGAMTCMEVLKSVLYSIGCRIVQGSGEGLKPVGYHIQRIEEMIESDTIEAFVIDKSTFLVTSSYTDDLSREITSGTNFFSPDLDITARDQNQELNVSERYNKVGYKYTTKEIFRKDAELLFNSTFDKGSKSHNNTTLFPKYFQVSTDITSSNACQLAATKDPKKKDLLFRAMYSSPSFPAMPATLAAQGTGVNVLSKYIRTTGTESGDTADVQTKTMSNINVATPDNIRISVKGRIAKGVDYSYATANGYNNENYITSPHTFEFGFWVSMAMSSGKVYYWLYNPLNNIWVTAGSAYANPQYSMAVVRIGTKGFSNNTYSGKVFHDDTFEIELNTPNIPQNEIANFSFRFYIPRTYNAYMQPIGMGACRVEELSMRYVTDGQFSDDIFKETVFFTLTDAKENTYNWDVMYGDGPAEYCLSSFRYGVVSASDKYKITSLWRKLDDSTQLPAYKIFNSIPAQKLISAYQRVISGDYIGIFDIVNTLNIDDGTDDKRFLIMGDSWDVKNNTHSIVMQEITEQSISVSYDNSTRLFQAPTSVSETPNNISSSTASIFSGKPISSAVILNQPSTFKIKQTKLNYPG